MHSASSSKRHRPFRASGFAVTHTELHLPRLDRAHCGLRVAHLSDIHVGKATSSARIRRAIDAVNEGKPDVVFLTGDYVTHSPKPIPRIRRLIAGLRAPTFAVLGNHDHEVCPKRVAAELDACGYRVLRNEHDVIRLRGAPLTVVGVDDGVSKSDDVDAAFDGAPSSGSRLVLAHTPPTVDKLPAGEGLLQFSGHTHGGHFLVPGLTRALFRMAGQPYVRGLYRVRGNYVYVNRGLGFGHGGPLLRFGSHPEVSFFTLRARKLAV
jgi:predicted MPP superfamily phosphohydrolase